MWFYHMLRQVPLPLRPLSIPLHSTPKKSSSPSSLKIYGIRKKAISHFLRIRRKSEKKREREEEKSHPNEKFSGKRKILKSHQ